MKFSHLTPTVFFLLFSDEVKAVHDPKWMTFANSDEPLTFFVPADENEKKYKTQSQKRFRARVMKQRQMFPDTVFNGHINAYNTRYGDQPGTEIDMHNDEPVNMAEANMDSSSESGNDDQETEEDKKNYIAAIKRADGDKVKGDKSNLMTTAEDGDGKCKTADHFGPVADILVGNTY